MGYISFQKEEITNLGNSLQKEFVKTNGAGSYASSTITFCNTRKYHGLLVSPVQEMSDENFVFLSSLDETVVQHEAEFNLALHQFPGEFNPLGHKYIEEFHNDPVPTTVYRVGGVVLTKEVLLPAGGKGVLIRYTLNEAKSKTILKLKPFTPFRNVHDMTHANLTANTRAQVIENGIKLQLYPSLPGLSIQLSKEAEYVPVPDWFYNVEYGKEQERGFEFQEDLFTPGYFEVPIKKGESVVFSASLQEEKTNTLKRTFTSQLKKQKPLEDFESCLLNSANAFVSETDSGKEIIASFPWPGKWGRDSMIALPGITLYDANEKACKEVLDSFTKEITGNLYHNKGNIEHHDINSIDTALWYIWSVQQLEESTNKPKTIAKSYGNKIVEILTGFVNNSTADVELHDNGLLYLASPDKALTWMDSEIDGHPIVRRWGYVVEINALWYNGLKFACELSKSAGLKGCDQLLEIVAKIEDNFKAVFWDDNNGYLADFVTHNFKDFAVRPNQIFASSLPFSPLGENEQRSIIDVVKSELLTPRGLRSLSPKNENYKGVCCGTHYERQLAYHQGSVWPWLLGPFAEAYLKIYGKSGLGLIKRIYEEQEKELKDHGLGTIAEIYDGDPPYSPRGATSQAWSVAELLRIKKLIEKTDEL